MPKWCPNWHGEFVDPVEVCPDCGADLVTDEPPPPPAVLTPPDGSTYELVEAGVRVERLTPLIRLAAGALYVVSALGVLSWAYSTWYTLDRTSPDSGLFGLSDDGLSIRDHIYFAFANFPQLLFAALVFASATALWMLSRWLDFRLRQDLYLDDVDDGQSESMSESPQLTTQRPDPATR